jgi:hypothetical protein
MATRAPRRRSLERFGTYNNLRSNPHSNFERSLDTRAGVLDPYTQIVQSTLQTSYTVDSLSAFGNTFRARILGVAEGKPARHLYPDLYANSSRAPQDMPNHFIFVLRDESDQFSPDPAGFAASEAGYIAAIGLQGNAISEKPASEEMERYAVGDIVEVYKPEQNSWNGALVRKVVVRNNFSADAEDFNSDGVVVGGAFNTTAGEAFSGSFGGESGYVAGNTGNGSRPYPGAYLPNDPKATIGVIPGSDNRLRYQDLGDRKWPVQPQLLQILQEVAARPEIDIYIGIWSGGQISAAADGVDGENRTGSKRHDDGWAADIEIYRNSDFTNRVRDGAGSCSKEDWSSWTDGSAEYQELYNIALSLWTHGITSMGANPGYQDGRIHVDISVGNNKNPEFSRTESIWGDCESSSRNRCPGDEGQEPLCGPSPWLVASREEAGLS